MRRSHGHTKPDPLQDLLEAARKPHDGRITKVQQALWLGATIEQLYEATGIDPWFLDQICVHQRDGRPGARRRRARPGRCFDGRSDSASPTSRSPSCVASSEDVARHLRQALGIRPVYKTVDTCAGEFAAHTPYHYSSYDDETEVRPRTKPAVIILGSGPNRIGQGIEFDYSCVHAALSLARGRVRDGDGQLQSRDGVDRLRHQRPALLRTTDVRGRARDRAGRAAGGTGRRRDRPARRSDATRDWHSGSRTPECPSSARRQRPSISLRTVGHLAPCSRRAGLTAPRHGTATSFDEAKEIADEIGYPVLVRPSYVLGGRGMEIVYGDDMLRDYIGRATQVSPDHPGARRPVPR